jgi:hypothetical protein
MREWARRLAFLFFAGALAGVLTSLGWWLLGAAGVMAQWGIALAPELTPVWLKSHLVTGGLWGMLLLPFSSDAPNRLLGLGAGIGLLPTCHVVMVQWTSPTGPGALAPFLVLAFCLLWGLATAGLLLALRE